MNLVLVFYHCALLYVGDGKLHQIVVVINLRRHDVAFLQGRLHHLAAFHIVSRSLDTFHALVTVSAKDAIRHGAILFQESRAATLPVHRNGHERGSQAHDIIAYRHTLLIGNDNLGEL